MTTAAILRRMLKPVVVVMGLVALIGVSHADTPEQTKIKALEAQVGKLEERVKQLEATNAQNAEALAFLKKVHQQQQQQAAAQDANEPSTTATFAVDIADSVKSLHTQGSATAAVTVVWAFDMADPYSARMQPLLEELLAARKGKLRIIYKHMIVHPNATPVHHAACAAAKQGMFAPFYKAWWETGWEAYKVQHDPDAFSDERLLEIGKLAGLDTKRMAIDMKGTECEKRVQADMVELQKFRVNSTPTFFINGHMSSGARDKDTIAQQLDAAAEEQKKSGVAAAKYYSNVVMKGEKQFKSRSAP